MDSTGKRLWAALWGSRSCRLRLPPSSPSTATSDQSELQQDQAAGKSIRRSTCSCSCAKDEHASRESMPRQASLGGNRNLLGCSTACCHRCCESAAGLHDSKTTRFKSQFGRSPSRGRGFARSKSFGDFQNRRGHESRSPHADSRGGCNSSSSRSCHSSCRTHGSSKRTGAGGHGRAGCSGKPCCCCCRSHGGSSSGVGTNRDCAGGACQNYHKCTLGFRAETTAALAAGGRVIASEQPDGAPFALGDLPASVLPEVFKHLPPADLLRMAQVCREFRDWLALDMIWAAQLPPSLPQILCKATPTPTPTVSAASSGGKLGSEQCAMSPQKRVRWLCEGVAVSEGRQRVRMDAGTRAIVCETCVALAVRAGAASIVRSGVVRDWVRASGMAGAAFPSSVAFKPVGGYELAVSGLPLLLSVLPPGEYSVGWRVKANPQLSSGQAIPPLTATLSMAVREGLEGISVCSLAAWRPSADPTGSASRMSALATSSLPSSSSSPSSLLLRAPSAPSSTTAGATAAAAAAAPAAAPAAAALSLPQSAGQANNFGASGGGTGQGTVLAAASQARPGEGQLARVARQEGVGTVLVPSRVEVKVQAFLDARAWVVLDVGVVRIPQRAVDALDDDTPILDLSFAQQPGAPQPGVLLDCLVLQQR